jgi:hypothetical protein
MVIVLNCVGERIISPFHPTVKIWSNLLDNQPAEHHFLSGFVSSATIHAVSQYSVLYRARKQAVALDARGIVPASQPVVSAPRGEK